MDTLDSSLDGRCGTCGFFVRLHPQAQENRWHGECRINGGPSPLSDEATCSSYVKRGEVRAGKFVHKMHGKRAMPRAPRQARRLPATLDWDMDTQELKEILREILQEELGVGEVDMAERWLDGELVLKPGKEGVQEKRIPIEALFHKIVMIRDKLRVLEQKINGNAKLDDEEKVQLQHYITGCYGSLTTFNVLFRRREDGFAGQSGESAS